MTDERRPLETAPRKDIAPRDTESPSHQRPPFADPLPGDPTAPGAPHEPGGPDYNQSRTDESPGAGKRRREDPPGSRR